MAIHAAQHTDNVNNSVKYTAVNAGDALTKVSSTSIQAVALNRDNQNTVTGEGGEAVTGNLQAGK